MSRRINLLRKFDVRPNIKTYLPKNDKSYIFNFFIDIVNVGIVGIYASIILMICIIIVYFVIMSLLSHVLYIMSINIHNDYTTIKAVAGMICLFIFSYMSYKSKNIKQQTGFSLLGLTLYIFLTVDLVNNYFLSKIDTNLEEGIAYTIIILCTYIFIVTIIYSIIYLYKNNKSYYFNNKTKFTRKVIYIISYFIFTLLPLLIIYLISFNTPVKFILICISTISILFLFMVSLVLANI